VAGRAAAGVGVLFTREFSAAGDKLSRQLGATVARLIGGMHAGGRARLVSRLAVIWGVIVRRRRRDESARRTELWSVSQSVSPAAMSSRVAVTSRRPVLAIRRPPTITLLVAERRAADSDAQSRG